MCDSMEAFEEELATLQEVCDGIVCHRDGETVRLIAPLQPETELVLGDLEITIDKQYIEEKKPPSLSLANVRGIEDHEKENVLKDLEEHARDMEGAEMLYSLILTGGGCLAEFLVPSVGCTICLSAYTEREDVMRVACDHYFHRSCLAYWWAVCEEEERQRLQEEAESYKKSRRELSQCWCPICREGIQEEAFDGMEVTMKEQKKKFQAAKKKQDREEARRLEAWKAEQEGKRLANDSLDVDERGGVGLVYTKQQFEVTPEEVTDKESVTEEVTDDPKETAPTGSFPPGLGTSKSTAGAPRAGATRGKARGRGGSGKRGRGGGSKSTRGGKGRTKRDDPSGPKDDKSGLEKRNGRGKGKRRGGRQGDSRPRTKE